MWGEMARIADVIAGIAIKQAMDLLLEDSSNVYLNPIAHTVDEEADELENSLFSQIGDGKDKTLYPLVIDNFTDFEFESQFQMSRTAFKTLLEMIAPEYKRTVDCFASHISIEEKALASVWLLSNPVSFRLGGEKFNMEKGTLHPIFWQFCQIVSNLKLQFIQFPEPYKYPVIADQFKQKTGFPGCVGVIGELFIPVASLFIAQTSGMKNRNHNSGVAVQAVCDHSYRFTDVECVGYGSITNDECFANSNLHGQLTDPEHPLLPSSYHFVGSCGYPLMLTLLTPFWDGSVSLADEQERYNRSHSRVASFLDDAFGMLKSRYQRLQHLNMVKMEAASQVVIAAFCLHNHILKHERTQSTDDSGDETNTASSQTTRHIQYGNSNAEITRKLWDVAAAIQ